MNITIGKKTLSVDGVIYISPYGDDTNDGLSTSTPVKSYKKALELCSNNYGIYFMAGTHIINDKTRQGSGYPSFYYITNNLGTDYNGLENLILFSNPLKTKIIINPADRKGTCSDYLLETKSKTFSMYNLNIEYIQNLNDYNSHFYLINSSSSTINLYNTIINVKTVGIGSVSYDIELYGSSTLNVYNSILYSNRVSSRDGNSNSSSSFTVQNSITSDFGTKPTTNTNSIYYSPTYTDLEDIIEEEKGLCTDTIGLYSGDYSEWGTYKVEEISIERISSTNLPTRYGFKNEIHLFFTSDKKLYVTDSNGNLILIQSHSHDNNDILNKFSVDTNGNLLFDGHTLNVQEQSISFKEYSNTDTYNINDYVIYNNKLYRCTTDITTPEEFNISNWQLVIGDETQYYVFKKVTELPTDNISENTIYLVQNEDSTSDIPEYIQYKYINGSWSILGGKNTSTNTGTTVSIGLTEW